MFIFIGLIMIVIGSFLIIKTEWFLNNFGRIAWFEEKLGTEGGSRFGYKLVGILFLIIGIINVTGSGNSFMAWVVSPLTQYSQQK
ncbi:MAG: hypothetical protein WC249_03040 [Patescibacteria group bacterium]|jgi:hypothetical protein